MLISRCMMTRRTMLSSLPLALSAVPLSLARAQEGRREAQPQIQSQLQPQFRL